LKNAATPYILGLDILPGDRRDPVFAAVILNENGEKLFSGEISRNRLLSFIHEKKIRIIAIDNIFELYPSTDEIIHFLKISKVRLIQVTGAPGKMQKLSHLSKLYKLHSGTKLSPHEAAEVAAKLAWLGVGSEVKVFEDITEITVSRTRSLGEGGQHQAKYARIIASTIQSVVREIEDTLRKHNLPYDISIREGDYGIKSAKIYVYEPYEKVKGLINDYHGSLFRIEIRPLEKERLIFTGREPLSEKKYFLICGIDPGETTGIALLDLSGNILYIGSRREFGFSNILETIYEYGKPVLIATDVPRLPQFIEKLCKKTGASLYIPKQPISISEKNEIVRELGLKVANTHERDALVAAIMAYKKYQKVFQRIDKILSYIPLDLDPNEIKKDIILGLSVKEAIYKAFEKSISSLVTLSEKEKKVVVTVSDEKLRIENEKLSKKIAELEKRIHFLEEEIDLLQKSIKEKDAEISYLKDKILLERRRYRQKMMKELEKVKDQYIRDLEEEITHLRLKLESYRKKIEKLNDLIRELQLIVKKKPNEVVIKRLKTLKKEEIARIEEIYGIVPGDVLYVQDPSGIGENTAKDLVRKGVKAIIVESDSIPEQAHRVFEDSSIPILYPEDFQQSLSMKEFKGNVILIDRGILEKAIKNSRLRSLPEEEREYYTVLDIINEYQRRRKKELQNVD